MKKVSHWHYASLEDVAEIQTGLSKSASRQGEFVTMPYLRVANVQDGHFDLSEVKTIEVPKESVERFRVRPNDVILTEGGDFDKLGRGAVWSGQIKDCVHQNHLFVVRPDPKRLDVRFFAYQTQGPRGRAYFQSCSKQSTNLASINSTQLKQFPTALPPLPEQRKIAEILSTWDEALETLDALIAAKDRQKQALMQQLLDRSLAHSKTSHSRHRLGEFCERVTRRNNTASGNVLTISAQQGLVSQKDYFNRSVAGADLANYYLLNRGEFAYNRSSAKGYPYGAIKRLDLYDCGVVSTLYLCFRIKPKVQVSSDYLSQYFEAGSLNSGLRCVAKEGARAHGLLNVTADEFFDLDIFLPPLSEQQQIAAILDTADQELTLLRTQRASIDQQKRGLMQRLLTGKLRVKF
jgi:type I restriction enzyme S subunit